VETPSLADVLMTDIDINSVLTQIRALQTQATNRPASGIEVPAVDGSAGPVGGFSAVLKSALDSVNSTQGNAQRLQNSFELGDPNTDLASVMLATGKAQVAFKGVVEVRNRLVSAYQDIMNMPL
jgi:flagellar hook-basal body complex protein FliE